MKKQEEARMSRPAQPQIKSFIEYRDYELYDSYLTLLEVPTRDLQKLDLKKLDWGIAPTFLGFADEFRFFDAEVTVENGRQVIGARTNYSKEYRVAEEVMTLADYKARELPKLAQYKQEKRSRTDAFLSTFFNGGLQLTRAFKEALAPRRPVMEMYISTVESVIEAAEKTGATHVAFFRKGDLAVPFAVSADMILLGHDLRQIHPAPSAAAHGPNGPTR